MDYRVWLAFAVGMFIGGALGVIIISMMHTAAMRIVFIPILKTDDERIEPWIKKRTL